MIVPIKTHKTTVKDCWLKNSQIHLKASTFVDRKKVNTTEAVEAYAHRDISPMTHFAFNVHEKYLSRQFSHF